MLAPVVFELVIRGGFCTKINLFMCVLGNSMSQNNPASLCLHPLGFLFSLAPPRWQYSLYLSLHKGKKTVMFFVICNLFSAVTFREIPHKYCQESFLCMERSNYEAVNTEALYICRFGRALENIVQRFFIYPGSLSTMWGISRLLTLSLYS